MPLPYRIRPRTYCQRLKEESTIELAVLYDLRRCRSRRVSRAAYRVAPTVQGDEERLGSFSVEKEVMPSANFAFCEPAGNIGRWDSFRGFGR
jgi:hypothetical protein